MMTPPNVLAIHVRRQEGARVPVAVEQQLDLPGFPVMELVGTGGLDEERAAGPSTTLASPSLRRLRRKSSAEEAAPVVSPSPALGSSSFPLSSASS